MPSEYQCHVEKWKGGCGSDLCPLAKRVVFARGKIPCDLLFVGEAPGESEDVTGQPFKGPAGHLLDRIIARALRRYPDLRLAFYNLVGCYPKEAKAAGINEPDAIDIKQCSPKLVEFVRIAKPKMIVTVGKLAASYIYGQAMFTLPDEDYLPWLPEGRYLEFAEIVHPAAILRANVAQQELMARRAAVTIENAVVERLL